MGRPTSRRRVRAYCQRKSQSPAGPFHLSSSAWVLASSSNKRASCFLYSIDRHGRLLVLQASICCSRSSFCASSFCFSGVVGDLLRAPDPQHRNARRQQAFAIFRRGSSLRLRPSGVFEHRVFGRQPLLRLVEIRCLLLAHSGTLPAPRSLHSCPCRPPDRAVPPPSSARTPWRSFGARLRRRDHGAVGLLQHSPEPPLALVMFTTSCRCAGTRSSSAASSTAERSGPGRLNL